MNYLRQAELKTSSPRPPFSVSWLGLLLTAALSASLSAAHAAPVANRVYVSVEKDNRIQILTRKANA